MLLKRCVQSLLYSRSFRFFGCFVAVCASVPLVYPERHDDGLVGIQTRQHIAVALAYWRLSEREGDEPRWLAFASLRQAFDHACALDVRLYLYMLSDEAAMLYQAYEREVTE